MNLSASANGSQPQNGFVPIPRAFFDHPFWREPREYSKAEAWIDLYRMASFIDHIQIIKGVSVALKRGELMVSERFLEGRWKWSRGKVRRFLVSLKAAHLVNTKQYHEQTHLTILEYGNYDHNRPSNGTSDSTSDDTKYNKGLKKGNKGNKNSDARESGSPEESSFQSKHSAAEGGKRTHVSGALNCIDRLWVEENWESFEIGLPLPANWKFSTLPPNIQQTITEAYEKLR